MDKLYRKLLLCAATLVTVAGCASGPSYREMAGSIPTLSPQNGRVYFFRSSSMVGAAMQPDIKLNGQTVGESTPGGFFYVDRPAGRYTVSTATETEKTLSLSLDAGETKYVRTSVSVGLLAGRVVPTLEDAAVAQKAIEGLSYAPLRAGDKGSKRQ
ncbi:DUF2846 domain-containing protein [Ralstonia solanacearum]|uniref:DUF2846 domain-containing protein n=1 Tax=Ralstonia solanacearum TaxID=305 RepID=A0AAE3NHR3_RALSL|nr:DUF2846 domain-containing protein [Ralstonia solanacearum]MBB6582011.1 DUF2846 domain-containing protein [Ralstonia solanacearum]MDB0522490.1 DUF2846 domain-containing protein [Ralstonia solanacearum]